MCLCKNTAEVPHSSAQGLLIFSNSTSLHHPCSFPLSPRRKKNQTKTCPLKLFINLHTSPLHWFLLLMLCAVRPLLFAFSILNYQPPINPHSTTINSAQTYCTYGPNYSRFFNILDYILSAMHFDPLFSAVFLDISVMHSKVYLASSACPLGVIQTYR